MKKIISIIVCLATVISVCFANITAVSAMTPQQGADWALAQIGKSIDTDGAYGAQCVDLIKKYVGDNWGWKPSGNAEKYRTIALPNSSWQRIQNTPSFVPQPGDIAIWNPVSSNGYCGHVAIIVSANVNNFVSVDQNWYNSNSTTGSPAAKVSHNYNNFWGVIRPPFTSATQQTQTTTTQQTGKLKNGVYTLKNVSSGYMMNVYAGKDVNGTKVTMWQYDGTTDQRINLQCQGNEKYLLKFNASSAGRVIDVNRGASLTASIDEHDKIDIWTADDLEAQLVYVNHVGNGAYTFELASKKGYVLSATGASAAKTNGAQLELLKYSGADYQKWIFCDTAGNKVNPCNHTATQEKADSTRYESLDENQHNIITAYNKYCSDCGDKLSAGQTKTSGEAHTVSNGKCTKCGYTVPVTETPKVEEQTSENKECNHEKTVESSAEGMENTVIGKDEEYHTVCNYYDLCCEECGAVIEAGLSNVYDEEHDISDNQCTKCGYVAEGESCEHNHKIKQASYDMADETKTKDEKSHTVTSYYNLYCTECKTVTETNLTESYDELHSFSNNTCEACGYTKPTATSNSNGDITVIIDGVIVIFDQPPIIKNNRTLVPLRAIFEALGAKVDWNGTTGTVTSTKGNNTISMTIGVPKMYKNNTAISLDTAPQITGGRTLVPVRAIAESFNCSVDWESSTKTVIITTNE